MTEVPFNLSRDDCGWVLLALSLSAICIYAPCRWLFRPVAPPNEVSVRKYLPYLYLMFAATLPIQLLKNYRYYEYAQAHGGYVFIYVNHLALASSVPFWVRVVSQFTLPLFVAIFVIERRKPPLYLATTLYFASASVILLLGARGATFTLVAALWWVARVKSLRKIRIVLFLVSVVALLILADVIQETRTGEENPQHQFSAVDLIISQGISLNVTEVVLTYRYLFSPYFGSYMVTEVQNAVVPNDVSTNRRGRSMANDVSVFLNPEAYRAGFGTAGSYVAEAYVGAGMMAVLLVSIALGLGLHAFYRFSGNVVLLFLFAIILPDVLLMPKGQLLDWVSVLLKNVVSIALLWFGWKIYSLLCSLKPTSPAVPAQAP